jgi:hypothetical protein
MAAAAPFERRPSIGAWPRAHVRRSPRDEIGAPAAVPRAGMPSMRRPRRRLRVETRQPSRLEGSRLRHGLGASECTRRVLLAPDAESVRRAFSIPERPPLSCAARSQFQSGSSCDHIKASRRERQILARPRAISSRAAGRLSAPRGRTVHRRALRACERTPRRKGTRGSLPAKATRPGGETAQVIRPTFA